MSNPPLDNISASVDQPSENIESSLELKGEEREEIVGLEKRLLAAIYAADKATMRQMMLPDGLGVDRSFGYATQESLIEGIHQVQAVQWSVRSPRVLALGTEARIVTYRLLQEVTFQGRPEPSDIFSTTVWSKIGNRWMAVFHQETPALHN
jgi:hypothetical protein